MLGETRLKSKYIVFRKFRKLFYYYDCDIVGHSIRFDATNDSDKDSNINDNNDNGHVPGKSW